MTQSPAYGYQQGERTFVRLPVKASQTIAMNDPVTLSSGYVARAAAGNKVYGFAKDAVTSPATDGVAFIEVDVSPESIYKLKSDDTISLSAHQFKKCDFGGYASDGTAQIDANGNTNGDLAIVLADVTNQFVLVQIRPAWAAVS